MIYKGLREAIKQEKKQHPHIVYTRTIISKYLCHPLFNTLDLAYYDNQHTFRLTVKAYYPVPRYKIMQGH